MDRRVQAAVTGQKDDFNRRRLGLIAADRGGQGQAVHAGHAQIGQHDGESAGRRGAELIQRVDAVVRGLYVELFIGQEFRDFLNEDCLVINDKDVRLHV